jgi:hypothetical protein
MSDDIGETIRHVGAAVKAARVATEKSGQHSGEIECPKCKGQLQYSIARSNGHVHGQCKTKGCLSWMM